ncbi:von Willebrand factor A domain-containing protein 5A-like isoform X2 [Mercenaria mercenaria]|uniref:von Willebrand factor A domain-containing protein 5A-like isoform X2 n=1 Tax=Mercenaria mercenaria TaxID=6596 RepID=UPI00234F9A7A|nr:von Willebrand factor A domain-containing protein 5A-like isoform X2 [Mercenaria mercenaria]
MAEKKEDKRKPLGLKTENGNPVPLKSIKVNVHIIGYVAEVSSRLTYFNAEETPVEAVFTFPVDDGSAVFQFEADIDGRHIVAEIQEKEQAKLTYQDAVDHGKTAMLLKEDNSAGDIFSCMLGNLPPQSEASLVMKYVIELPQEADGQLRFTLPTVLNPRYSPDVGGLTAAEGATYVPPSKVPYEFSMTATVEGYHKVTSVTSDRVKLDVKYEDNNKVAKVSIGDDFKFDLDIQFLVQYEVPYAPQVVLEDGNTEAEGLLKEDILMVSFHPDLKEVAMATNGEYIFVIDRSGSMMGDQIENAKEALLLFLKSLPPDCYFNIISFGSSFSSLFSGSSKKYAEDSLNEAIKLQEKMSADMGGTEILKPLESVFKKKLLPEHPRRVFVLTDGGVSNTDKVIGLVRKQSQNTSTRVFTLGIGHGVSTALVKGMANNGGGKAEFIAGQDRIQPKVISLLKCAMQPAITDITISWDLPPDVTPVSIPTEPPTIISAGERMALYAILQGVDKHTVYAPSTVTLKGQQDRKPVSYSMTFTICETDDISTSAPVHRLATKVQIKLLQDQESASLALDDDYRFQEECENIQTLREKIINISCQGNIISKYTSFVAIDTEGKRVEGKSVQRSCPVPTLSKDYKKGIDECSLKMCGLFESDLVQYNLVSCGLDAVDSAAMHLTSSKRKKKKGGILGCGPSLSALFSKKSRKRKSSAPKLKPKSVDAEDCADGAVLNPEILDEADAVDSADVNKSVEDGGSDLVKDSAVDSTDVKMSVEDSGSDRVKDDAVDSVDVKVSVEDSSSDRLKDDAKSSIRKRSTSSQGSASGSSKQKDDQMMAVISLQQLRGQWNVSDKLLQLLGIAKEDIEKLDFTKDQSVVCTVIVLCWLRKQFSHRQEEWQMIETKALAWISSQNLNTPTEDLIKQTTQAFWPK